MKVMNGHRYASQAMSSTTDAPSDVENAAYAMDGAPSKRLMSLRDDLLRTTKNLVDASPSGLFLTLPNDIAEFTKGVARLEAIAPTTSDESEKLVLGDWCLLATSKSLKIGKPPSSSSSDEKKLKLPKLPSKLQHGITVTQRIRSTSETDNIDRVDNVIEINNGDILPAFLNPLKIQNSKIVLIHKAKVEGFNPFRTRISLQSIVLNIAGTSQNLDPLGADLLAVNIPSLTEWMNSGSFDTTYVDDKLRISRGTTGFFEETRVFLKKGVKLEDIVEIDQSDVVVVEKSKLDEVADALEGVASAVGNTVTEVRDTVDKNIGNVSKEIESSIKDVETVIEEDIKSIGDEVENVKNAIFGDDESSDGESEGRNDESESSEDNLTA
jgi:gas vesicle protein